MGESTNEHPRSSAPSILEHIISSDEPDQQIGADIDETEWTGGEVEAVYIDERRNGDDGNQPVGGIAVVKQCATVMRPE